MAYIAQLCTNCIIYRYSDIDNLDQLLEEIYYIVCQKSLSDAESNEVYTYQQASCLAIVSKFLIFRYRNWALKLPKET